jgi:hypothetical protein
MALTRVAKMPLFCRFKLLAAFAWIFTVDTSVVEEVDTFVCGLIKQCISGECIGFNAKHNIDRMTRTFFNRLLDDGVSCRLTASLAPANGRVGIDDSRTVVADCTCSNRIAASLRNLRQRLNSLEINAFQLMQKLEVIRNDVKTNCRIPEESSQ